MRLPIDIKRCGLHSMWDGNRWLMAALLAYALLWLGHGSANAQIASSNPLEYAALAEGNELINAQIKSSFRTPSQLSLR